jgi:hypothetical protein
MWYYEHYFDIITIYTYIFQAVSSSQVYKQTCI